jgi:hypothetical protein
MALIGEMQYQMFYLDVTWVNGVVSQEHHMGSPAYGNLV